MKLINATALEKAIAPLARALAELRTYDRDKYPHAARLRDDLNDIAIAMAEAGIAMPADIAADAPLPIVGAGDALMTNTPPTPPPPHTPTTSEAEDLEDKEP